MTSPSSDSPATGGASAGAQDLRVEHDGESYVLRRDGDALRVGRDTGDGVLWQDETVPIADLPDAARDALGAGDAGHEALRIAVAGIVSGAAHRGG
jgi:hypothetical protein